MHNVPAADHVDETPSFLGSGDLVRDFTVLEEHDLVAELEDVIVPFFGFRSQHHLSVLLQQVRRIIVRCRVRRPHR